MTEEYWANSQYSIARYYGGCTINSKNYRIVNQYGIDLFALSTPGSRYYVGDNRKAIEPGEPADLVQLEWIPIYRKIGREKFIKLLKDNPNITLKQAKTLCNLTNTNKKEGKPRFYKTYLEAINHL